MTAPLTVDDRELIEEAFALLCRKYVQRSDERQKDMGLQYTEAETHDLAKTIAQFTRQSLLSDRDKLELLLERVWACRADVQGRFVNLEKLWPVMDDIGVVLIQREVP
jgi:hypothetical protein